MAASPRLRFRRCGLTVALDEPSVDLVLEIVHDARAAAMIRGPIAFHAPFGKGRTTEAEVASGNYGPDSLTVTWGHWRSSWQMRFHTCQESDRHSTDRQVKHMG
jgi:hypothetical protein